MSRFIPRPELISADLKTKMFALIFYLTLIYAIFLTSAMHCSYVFIELAIEKFKILKIGI